MFAHILRPSLGKQRRNLHKSISPILQEKLESKEKQTSKQTIETKSNKYNTIQQKSNNKTNATNKQTYKQTNKSSKQRVCKSLEDAWPIFLINMFFVLKNFWRQETENLSINLIFVKRELEMEFDFPRSSEKKSTWIPVSLWKGTTARDLLARCNVFDLPFTKTSRLKHHKNSTSSGQHKKPHYFNKSFRSKPSLHYLVVPSGTGWYWYCRTGKIHTEIHLDTSGWYWFGTEAPAYLQPPALLLPRTQPPAYTLLYFYPTSSK